jgi:hypothetical protein
MVINPTDSLYVENEFYHEVVVEEDDQSQEKEKGSFFNHFNPFKFSFDNHHFFHHNE